VVLSTAWSGASTRVPQRARTNAYAAALVAALAFFVPSSVAETRETGETRSDVKWRVRLDLLSARIQRDVTRGHKSYRAQAHALGVFVAHFQPRWRARTWCRDDYKLADYCR
jgi:hypothetical protein